MDEQLRALVAVVDEESFEAAAFALGISPSAVSQRVKALERRVGQPVVRRTIPTEPTPAGRTLIAMARRVRLVEEDALATLGLVDGRRALTLAVPADTLATWFSPVLAHVAGLAGTTLRLHVEDQDHSARLLRDGDVVGAVTSQEAPVAGCTSEPLGAMRYLPVATPALAGSGALADLPMVRFNAKDDLQHTLLRARGIDTAPATHLVPGSEGFAAAVRAGLGWGMLPEAQLGDDLERGRLVRVDPGHVDVALHWQAWRVGSERLDAVAGAVRAAARTSLRTLRDRPRPSSRSSSPSA